MTWLKEERDEMLKVLARADTIYFVSNLSAFPHPPR